jgi:hypothetical protein
LAFATAIVSGGVIGRGLFSADIAVLSIALALSVRRVFRILRPSFAFVAPTRITLPAFIASVSFVALVLALFFAARIVVGDAVSMVIPTARIVAVPAVFSAIVSLPGRSVLVALSGSLAFTRVIPLLIRFSCRLVRVRRRFRFVTIPLLPGSI